MTQAVRNLGSGQGWRAREVVCTAGPDDRAFTEEHDTMCIAVVTHGAFRYRTRQGVALMAPGAILLGNAGACFECGHEHGRGDRCISFQFEPDHWGVLCDVAGVDAAFGAPRIPPAPTMARLLVDVEAARDDADETVMEEIALRLADAAMSLPADSAVSKLSARDHKRVHEAVRSIELGADEPIVLAELAEDTATSRFHFLRIFRRIVGVTPHQFVLRTRLHRAALRLRQTDENIAAIAFDVGFGDLSTFNRRFARIMGMTPGRFRQLAAGRNVRLRVTGHNLRN